MQSHSIDLQKHGLPPISQWAKSERNPNTLITPATDIFWRARQKNPDLLHYVGIYIYKPDVGTWQVRANRLDLEFFSERAT